MLTRLKKLKKSINKDIDIKGEGKLGMTSRWRIESSPQQEKIKIFLLHSAMKSISHVLRVITAPHPPHMSLVSKFEQLALMTKSTLLFKLISTA